MPFYAKVSGVHKATRPYVKVAGVWKAASAVYTKVAGVWKAVYANTFNVNLSAPTALGDCTDFSYCTATSSPVTATPDGGIAPYTYSWVFVSGDSGILPDTPAAATTTWTQSNFTPQFLQAIYRCDVTDALGTTISSANVTVDMQFNT